MSRILIMSSWVAVGHVGLSAAVPVLQALGHDVTQLPTTVLSNHRAWPRAAGGPVPPEQLSSECGPHLEQLGSNSTVYALRPT